MEMKKSLFFERKICKETFTKIYICVLLAGSLMLVSCAENNPEKKSSLYAVNKIGERVGPYGEWNGEMWGNVSSLELKYFMGQRPSHFPEVKAKLVYDDEFLHVIFHVEDRYVRAVAEGFQGRVCRTGCV